ncbi:hypothetical protein ABZ490_13010 [Streptomyces sp. NPDC005811]|uniref:hypothetical protein n=1 Tax=Streptomyces sp. NPDC005811 TaxID=3154565 RepID=UPI0033FA00B0
MAGEWDWLRAPQPGSKVPEALYAPTASPSLNLGVQVIGSNIVGNDVVEIAAQYMAEHARFEMWMASHEPRLGFQRQDELGQAPFESMLEAYRAWVAFETAYQASGRRVDRVRDEREELKAALRKAVDILVHARVEEQNG